MVRPDNHITFLYNAKQAFMWFKGWSYSFSDLPICDLRVASYLKGFWGSTVRLQDSHMYTKIEITSVHMNLIFDIFVLHFSFFNATGACTVLVSSSGFNPSSVRVAPKYLKTVDSFKIFAFHLNVLFVSTCAVGVPIAPMDHHHHQVILTAQISQTLSLHPFRFLHCSWQIHQTTFCVHTELM